MINPFKEAPRWKQTLFVASLLLAAAYLTWCAVHTSPPPAGAPTQLAPAVSAPKVEGPKLKVPLKVVPKRAVKRAVPEVEIPEGEEVVDTGVIPPSENGGKLVVFMNVTTGTARSVYVPNAAPWFAFEGRNEVSIGIEKGSRGTRVPVEYRRDLLRVKDLHAVVDGGVGIPTDLNKNNAEWHIGARAAWRW